MSKKLIFIGSVSVATLTGCAEEASTTAASQQRLQTVFAQMENPCLTQATRLTGLSSDQIVVTNQIPTGGGPLLTLDANGKPYSCRKEADGSVTVFSEFAN